MVSSEADIGPCPPHCWKSQRIGLILGEGKFPHAEESGECEFESRIYVEIVPGRGGCYEA